MLILASWIVFELFTYAEKTNSYSNLTCRRETESYQFSFGWKRRGSNAIHVDVANYNLIFISVPFFILFMSFTFSVRLFDSLYLFWGFGLYSYIYF